MVRCFNHCTLFALLICVGCGKSEVTVSNADSAPSDASASVASQPSAVDVVSSFLDQIRRGGEDSGAGDLLTEKARSELNRIGRSIEPVGSPDARYEVTRAENVPGQADSALVHSIWSDPNGVGGQSDFQVVWAVAREPVGWRISGMAIQEQEGQEPVIIDFENGDLMAEVLGATDPQENSRDPQENAQSPAAQAAAPAAAIAR